MVQFEKFKNITGRRNEFPSIKREHNGHTLAYFDGPGGTQVPDRVIDSISSYYKTSNTNTHGCFVTSEETDNIISSARKAMADLLGAGGYRNISFGNNMTTLNFSLSKAIGRYLQPGDEIIITQLDHESNRGPWLNLREKGVIIREVKIKPDCTLDYDDFEEKMNENTRLVAMGLASNAFGTVNDAVFAREITYRYGAWLLLDAVHYVPHFPVDVNKIGPDFLLCSVYKFYGPHVGILYSKEGLLDMLHTDNLRTQDQQAPYKIETGTLNHAALSGVSAAVDFIASFGEGENKRNKIVSGMELVREYEHYLGKKLFDGLKKIPGVKVYGQNFDIIRRAPTVSFTINDIRPNTICTILGKKGILTWDGNFYAVKPAEVLGLYERGGVVRAGISLYNTETEVDRLINEVEQIAGGEGE